MAAVPGAEWRVPLWNTAGFEPRPAARLRLAPHYPSLSLSSPPLPTLSLTPSTRPRLLSSPFPSGTSLRPCHSLPSLRSCSSTWSSLSLSLFLHLYSSQSCPLSSFESLRCSLPSSSLTVNARDNDETTRALPILAPVFSSRPYPPLLLFRLETHSRGTMGGGGCGGGGGEKEDQAC